VPYATIETNAALPTPEASAELLKAVSRIVAEGLGKPERVMMTRLAPRADMTYGGSTDPCCFISVQLVGSVESQAASDIARALTERIREALGVAEDRVFIVFGEVTRKHWGLAGKMLG